MAGDLTRRFAYRLCHITIFTLARIRDLTASIALYYPQGEL